MPGQTGGSVRLSRRGCGSFNGGPGNCPAKPLPSLAPLAVVLPSMEGRAIARPNELEMAAKATPPIILQWRAGQLPGQTRRRPRPPPRPVIPSMEGRAIARPNPLVSLGLSGLTRHLQWRAGQLPGQTRRRCSSKLDTATFNGGPGNCPAKPVPELSTRTDRYSLQWRAGQLPGQTQHPRPGRRRESRLQWRAGQLPGQTPFVSAELQPMVSRLQWRAGQLPGQTWSVSWFCGMLLSTLQWRAGQLPGQTRSTRPRPTARRRPSMEGRAIARPNRSR